MEQLFSISGLLVIPFWLLMIALPTWKWTSKIIGSLLIVAAPSIVYAILVLPRIAVILPAVLNPKITEIAPLLGSPDGATIAWMHFLAFDLFVGRWAFLDSRERRVNPWLMAPILFFILMLGPIGFLLYLAIRTTSRQPLPDPAKGPKPRS